MPWCRFPPFAPVCRVVAHDVGEDQSICDAVRNVVEPKLVGSQMGLHPLVTLISMFLGLQLFGLAGLFGFPIALSLGIKLCASRRQTA